MQTLQFTNVFFRAEKFRLLKPQKDQQVISPNGSTMLLNTQERSPKISCLELNRGSLY